MNIIIADDEHLVRYSLRSMLDELGLGLNVVAEAANGQDLLDLLARHQPELCFVDIRMPGLNGLAAIRKAREAGSRTRWIILTSHAEFDYAAEAIGLGASAYLLKPAGPANLAEALEPLLRDLEQERRANAARFEDSLIVALGSALPDMSKLPPLPAAWVMLLQLDCGINAPRLDRSAFAAETIRALRKLISPALGGSLVAATWLYAPNLALIAASWNEHDAAALKAAGSLREAVSALASRSSGLDLQVTAFASDILSAWAPFKANLEALRDSLPHRVILGTGTTHHLAGMQRRLASLPASLRDLGQLACDFIESRQRGATLELEAQAHRLRDCFLANAPAVEYLERACRFIAFHTGQADGISFQAWIDGLVSSTRAEMPGIRRNVDANVRVVERVEQYLRQHLRQEVRVPDIASDLGLSPNYLSSIYHRLTQCTISERLAGLRLEMARDLLARPGSQVKEVAAEVGYKSTRHFAQLYRERYGQYPSGR